VIIYLSTPIAGLDPRASAVSAASAAAAAQRLRGAGFDVLSLTELPVPEPEPTWRGWLKAGIMLLLEADGMVRIPGEGRAPGVELRLAHELGIPIKTVPGWLTHAGQADYMKRLRG
jgi:kynurenine formamidase